MNNFNNIEAVKAYAKHTAITTGAATQEKKKEKLFRYNLGLTPANKEFIQIVSKATERSQNETINAMIEAYRQAHPEAIAKAREVLELFNKE